MLDSETSDVLANPYKYEFITFAKVYGVGLPTSVIDAWNEWVQSCQTQYQQTSSFEGMSKAAIRLLTSDDTTDPHELTTRAISQISHD